MSKEASTEKASERFFEKTFYATGRGKFLGESKSVYDLLVSLEAKIEELGEICFERHPDHDVSYLEKRWNNYKAEYQKLIEQHKLT